MFMLSGLGDIGLNVLLWLLIMLVFSMLVDSCSLDLFGIVFSPPMVCDILKFTHDSS